MRSIDYYFTLLSPFAYLGHRAFLDVARKHNAEVRFKPVNLMDVWEESGAVPLAQRPKTRQHYRLIELQRWSEVRGVALTLSPKHFPTNPALADRSVIALVRMGKDPADYMEAVFQALWVDEQDIAGEDVLAQRLSDTGHDAAAVLLSVAHQDQTSPGLPCCRIPQLVGVIITPKQVWDSTEHDTDSSTC